MEITRVMFTNIYLAKLGPEENHKKYSELSELELRSEKFHKGEYTSAELYSPSF